jgi:hypothetical protein
MATQIVMDRTGDTRLHFDKTDNNAPSKAEERFERLTGLGFTAAVRSASGGVAHEGDTMMAGQLTSLRKLVSYSEILS